MYRYRGEEVVVVVEQELGLATAAMERVRRAVQDAGVEHRGNPDVEHRGNPDVGV